MFKNNKYKKIYFNIIEKARKENRSKGGEVYYESHHIIPKSLGGNNKKGNLILLTAKEHFICHKLLCKMVNGGKAKISMNFALAAFTRTSNKSLRKLKAKDYEFIRKTISKQMKDLWNDPVRKKEMINKSSTTYKNRYKKGEFKHWALGKTGEKSPLFGRKHTEETKKKQSAKAKDRERIKCDYCLKSFDPGNFKRYHGEYCKSKIPSPSNPSKL